ncbi:MAG: gamma-glutamylcyclotransferase family protein [Tumebacillaceae bacterium]
MFVYGTLLRGERNHRVVAPYLKAVQPGTVRGRLYDVGTYPALVLDENASPVVGEWFTVTGAGLKAMDALEEYFGPGHVDNEYERVRVTDLSNGRYGWVYVWLDSRERPEIVGGNWREFEKSRK